MSDCKSIKRQEWNSRHRPLSFSHQEVTSEAVKHHRQLRHSVSQREVSRHSRQSSVDSRGSSVDLKKPPAPNVEAGTNLSNQNPTVAKSTPQLPQTNVQRHSSSSSSLLQSDVDEVGNTSMVTRRFKKGSVYDTLASTSGLDFSPVVQLKTYHSRRDGNNSQIQTTKPTSMPQEKSTKPLKEMSPLKDLEENIKEPNNPSSTMNQSPIIPDTKQGVSDKNINSNCINAHEKYPSWPAGPSESESWSASQRSHSWTEQTDYPKEKVVYSRPKKDNQFKISTNQLQPVLERASDYNKIPHEAVSSIEKNSTGDKYQTANTHARTRSNSTFIDCNGKQFDFEGFHTPCIPQYFEEKTFPTHSPPVREGSVNDSLNTSSTTISDSSNNFNSRYEEVFHNDAQFAGPVSAKSKIKIPEIKNEQTPQDTPFLDRLRMENSWNGPPPAYPIHPAAVSPHQPQQMQHPQEQQGNDFEVSSENGTWMGSMESSTHERILPKWQGSYSDLSTLSTQFSNRSSMFDSGHSTLPESGRLSPQSSCDSTVTSLLLEGSTRAQVVARHGCHREIVAHSARVQPPERHGSESVLYYTGASSRSKSCDNSNIRNFSKNTKPVMDDSSKTAEKALFRSHASLTLSPPMPKSKALQSKEQCNTQFPKRQNSRNNLNSHFEESNSQCSNGTSNSPDVTNITCKPNYKEHSKNGEKSCTISNKAKPAQGYPSTKSKSMDETAKSCSFTEIDKKRISDPDLKAIQKQAVMSFYQRMSLAESIKSDSKLDSEPPPPYEARASHKLRMSPPKLSLLPNKPKLMPPNCSEVPRPKNVPVKASDPGLLRNHSKSVPNLVRLKGQSLDLPPSHPFFKQTYNGVEGHNQKDKNQCSPLAKDEIISWDELPNVLERKRELQEKAASSSNEKKDPPEDNDGCTR